MLTEGVRGLLKADFQTVYIVADVPSVRQGARQLTPALVVLDLSLAGPSSHDLMKEIQELSPDSKIIVLSLHDDAAVVHMAIAAGAKGVVLKRALGSDFLSAVSAVMRGERFVSTEFEGIEGAKWVETVP